MNPDILSETIQKGVRVTLGATASMLDALKDPQGSQAKFSEIGTDVDRLTETLEARGAETEQEARQMVDTLIAQMPPMPANPFDPTPASDAVVDARTVPVTDVTVQRDLEALTLELASLRREIENLKSQ
jgi:polyhydroxyalkanoate synthesis regulator phasin